MPEIDAHAFITEQVRNYYKANKVSVDSLEQREFGFGNFDTKIAFRHLAFKTPALFNDYLVKNAPVYVSYSAAYYKYPDARPIENKQRMGSELIFDLDSTDLNLECQKTHDRKWVCENCFATVRDETLKLVEDFLVPDFGISEKEMHFNFSGNHGYHIHVKSKAVMDLSAYARKEISNFIAGSGISFQEFFPTGGQRGMKLFGPKPTDPGWGGKIARNFLSRLERGVEALTELGIDARTAKALSSKRALIELGIKNGNWDMVYIKDKANFWKSIVERQSVNQGDKIDTQVTGDVTRLIRMPDTIHGGSCLLAKSIGSKAELSKYDPMKTCIVLPSTPIHVKAVQSKKLLMNGEAIEIEKDKGYSLPTYAAVYLNLKDCAILEKE